LIIEVFQLPALGISMLPLEMHLGTSKY